jgi:hypothetical protein
MFKSLSADRNSSNSSSSAEEIRLVVELQRDEACRFCASEENIFRKKECPLSHRKGTKLAITEWASCLRLGLKVNVRTYSDYHCLSMVWKRGAVGESAVVIDIKRLLKLLPVEGSISSKIRLVTSSQVVPVAKLDERADCLATHDANLDLFVEDKTELNVGMRRILVPSGNLIEDESYQWASFCLSSWTLSAAHSTRRALTLSDRSCRSFRLTGPEVVLIGFHLMPKSSPVIDVLVNLSACLCHAGKLSRATSQYL